MKYRHFLLIFLFFSCRENKLDGKVQTIRCKYIAWACDCANWATLEDMHKYSGDTLAAHCMFMEPADTSLHEPEVTIEDEVEFTGQFYKDNGFPKGHHSAGMQDKARVFRFTKYRVIRHPTP